MDTPAPSIIARLLGTDTQNRLLLGQRLLLAAVMLPHGAQKLLGWFGGFGFQATMGYFTGTLHIPAPLALLVIVAESIGALGLAFGLLSRVAGFGLFATMAGAALMSHLDNGFFMNWFGAQKGEGFEYHLLAMALALPIVLAGGGKYALDTWLARKLGERFSRRAAGAAVALATPAR